MEAKLKICHRCQKLKKLWRSNPPTCLECDRIIKAEKKTSESQQTTNKPVYQTAKIKREPTRQQKLDALYLIQNKIYLKNNTLCKANRPGCTIKAKEVHHKRGRGQYLLDETTWLPVCKHCHRWIEDHPKAAKALGLSENRLDKY